MNSTHSQPTATGHLPGRITRNRAPATAALPRQHLPHRQHHRAPPAPAAPATSRDTLTATALSSA
ncbi:hypothetical protein ACH3Y9_30940 [Streptomyces sp. WSLK1-5]|uniref:hypothetical protein n=1 Tax=unclassified Streptomyces TaxID=2593676 RepID=UPI00379C2870